jgi:transposase
MGVVVESTFNWYWLVDGLMEAGYPVHLANTAAIQQYSGLKYTDDRSDARWLAHLLRLKLLPEGYIYPKAERAVRERFTQTESAGAAESDAYIKHSKPDESQQRDAPECGSDPTTERYRG